MKTRHLILPAALFMLGNFNAFAAERFIYEPTHSRRLWKRRSPSLFISPLRGAVSPKFRNPLSHHLPSSPNSKLMIFDVDFDTQKGLTPIPRREIKHADYIQGEGRSKLRGRNHAARHD